MSNRIGYFFVGCRIRMVIIMIFEKYSFIMFQKINRQIEYEIEITDSTTMCFCNFYALTLILLKTNDDSFGHFDLKSEKLMIFNGHLTRNH